MLSNRGNIVKMLLKCYSKSAKMGGDGTGRVCEGKGKLCAHIPSRARLTKKSPGIKGFSSTVIFLGISLTWSYEVKRHEW
jgi:hypothetical protein